jgi:hypothetical protein
MSNYGYKQAIKARDLAYERKGMIVGLPTATMSADHLSLFIKEYEALERAVKDLKGDLSIANLRLKARRTTDE